MSDPYHTYDKHNIQVNVFHVKNTLRGLSPSERKIHCIANVIYLIHLILKIHLFLILNVNQK